MEPDALLLGSTYRTGRQHEIWAWMREHAPVHRHEPGAFPGFWSLTRYDEIKEVLRDADAYSSSSGILLRPLEQGADPGGGRTLALSDPGRHQALRGAVANWFAPRALRRLAESMERTASAIVGECLAAGRIDFVTDVAAKLPVEVVCSFMDIPATDRPDLVGWATAAFCADTPTERSLAHLEILEYFTDLAERRRDEPGEDLVSVLTRVRLDGELLPVEDVVLNCDSLFVGATENVRQTLAAGMLALLEHPAQWELLRADFERFADPAIEEILRWTSTGTHTMRRATRPAELGGRAIAAGDLLVCWLPSANRDGAHFPRPDVFDLTRAPNQHLTLGFGPHYCVGTQLARLEIRAILREFTGRVGRVALDGAPEFLESPVIGGPGRLPLSLSRSTPEPIDP
ncbi:cytochrome P450 [Streptosporangium sp. NPDC023615]|uniref:cytochrome P450 n=1 Tax=Streptosporangium sp. NPDC023615 TaxID=3154794 RepID=UPI00343A6CD6